MKELEPRNCRLPREERTPRQTAKRSDTSHVITRVYQGHCSSIMTVGDSSNCTWTVVESKQIRRPQLAETQSRDVLGVEAEANPKGTKSVRFIT